MNWGAHSCQSLSCYSSCHSHCRIHNRVLRCRHNPLQSVPSSNNGVTTTNVKENSTLLKGKKDQLYLKYPMIKTATSREPKDTAYPVVYMTYSRSKNSCWNRQRTLATHSALSETDGERLCCWATQDVETKARKPSPNYVCWILKMKLVQYLLGWCVLFVWNKSKQDLKSYINILGVTSGTKKAPVCPKSEITPSFQSQVILRLSSSKFIHERKIPPALSLVSVNSSQSRWQNHSADMVGGMSWMFKVKSVTTIHFQK